MSSDEDVRLEQLISTLATATTGDLSVRVPLQEEGRPSLIELEYAVNAVLADLELARLESDQRQQQIQQQAARAGDGTFHASHHGLAAGACGTHHRRSAPAPSFPTV